MSNRKLTALTALSLGLCAASAALALANPDLPNRGVAAAIGAFTLAVLLGVGIYAWQRGGQGRFGQVLFATGICWFLATLSNSDVDLVYSVGRIAGWVFEVALIYALVSYPTGRLEGRPARMIAGGAALLVVLLYLPTVPLIEQYPVPTPFTTCTGECPANSFFVGSEPGFVDDVVKPLREILTVAFYVSVVALLSLRLRAAGRNLRRTLVPVLGAAVLRFAAASVYVALRRADVETDVISIAAAIALLTIAATALGFLVGLLQWRIYSGGALATLTTGLGETRNPAQLRDLLVRSLGDPAVALYYSPPVGDDRGPGQRWLNATGQECAGPVSGPGTCLREINAESGLRAAVVCDRGFGDYPDFLEAVSSCVISGLERQRLDAALAASLDDVAASRKRLAGAADGARRKIERDLHDGAQQQLVALRVKLELAREAVEHDPEAAAALAGLGPEVDEIIEEVRSLARGIYPPLLASDGLGEALRAAGQRSPLPVTIEADGVGRLPPETESAVYFCCLEAMQNAAKHAVGASRIRIALSNHGELNFEVADDGCGFSSGQAAEGSGITGMHDRLAAVGGELRVESSADAGTRVRGRISLD